MKVLHLISGGDSGGAKTHVLTLLRELNTDTEANLLCLGRGPLWDAAEKELFNSRLCTGGFLRGVREVRATLDGGDYDILHCHGARADLTAALAGDFGTVSLLTGPEGGFAPEEVLQAEKAGLTVCTLGRRILRCETAPLCALSAVMFAAGEY